MYTVKLDINELIREDVPYFDLTSYAMGLNHQKSRIAVYTREDCVVCGTEEAAEVFDRLGIETISKVESGVEAKAKDELLVGVGEATGVFTSWKVVQNLIDHCSGIATQTRKLVKNAKEVNPNIEVLTTRKIFPGTKALAVKSIMAGGAMPHRMGLSETVLVFPQHINILGGQEEFIKTLPQLKRKCCEKKILVETNVLEDAIRYCKEGADGIQVDKLSVEELKKFASGLKQAAPHAVILGAGGINPGNVKEYAATGIDGIVTTSLYHAKPIDVGVKITPVK